MIMTVKGAIDKKGMGKTLVHEHILVDFSSAEEQIKIDDNLRNEIIEVMLPYLVEIKELGYSTFFECTPKYVGRDVKVLKILSEKTGLNIITNTGFYGAGEDKHVPKKYWNLSSENFAKMWIEEWEKGIEDGIKPGFIKTAVNPGPLNEIDKKLIRASAFTHLETGLTVACHTGEERCALEVARIFEEEGVDLSALIIVHADAIENFEVHLELLEKGAFLEYDSIGARPIEYHLNLIEKVIKEGFIDRILISHDAGWFTVGKSKEDQNIRPYTDISYRFIPKLKEKGISEDIVEKLLVKNPSEAFDIRVRKR